MPNPNDVIGNVIHPDDWPGFLRMYADYKAGRFTRKPRTEGRPPRKGDRPLLLGVTQDRIPSGGWGDVRRLAGPKGEETPSGPTLKVYNRINTLAKGRVVYYRQVNGSGLEIIQAVC
jgi:hypothetical protein